MVMSWIVEAGVGSLELQTPGATALHRLASRSSRFPSWRSEEGSLTFGREPRAVPSTNSSSPRERPHQSRVWLGEEGGLSHRPLAFLSHIREKKNTCACEGHWMTDLMPGLQKASRPAPDHHVERTLSNSSRLGLGRDASVITPGF